MGSTTASEGLAAAAGMERRALYRWRPRWQECVFLALCFFVLAKLLFLPGFIGLADNGDFWKICGRVQLSAGEFSGFFQPLHLRGWVYRRPSWTPSSEALLAVAAAGLERRLGDRATFDIRWLGAFHAALFAGTCYLLLMLLRPLCWWLRALLSMAALLIFADVGLVAYFNSFYMDAAALLGGFALVVLAVHLLWRPEVRPGLLAAFGLAAVLYCMSKPAHSPLGILPAAFAVAIAWRTGRRGVRIAGVAVAVCVGAGIVRMILGASPSYRVPTQFDVVFYRIANGSKTPAAELREVGLDETYVRWAGMKAFETGWPGVDPAWEKQFCARTDYNRILRYYISHPLRTAGFLWKDLRDEAWKRRPDYLGNFQRTAGHPPRTLTRDFAWWSTYSSRVLRAFPPAAALWHGAALIACPLLAVRVRFGLSRALAWGLVLASALACGEFFVNCLADSVDAGRHLVVFHLYTDATLFLAMVLAASLWSGRTTIHS